MRTHVAGAPYRIGSCAQADEVFSRGQRLRAVREPRNACDPHAVALYLDDRHVGYVPRAVNRGPESALTAGENVYAVVVSVDPDNPWEGVEIELTWREIPINAVTGGMIERAG